MSEYIERTEIERFIAEHGNVGAFSVDLLPTADVAPVRHGRWLAVQEKRLFGDHYFLCSNCKSRNGLMISFNYCPNCGARMDGGDE